MGLQEEMGTGWQEVGCGRVNSWEGVGGSSAAVEGCQEHGSFQGSQTKTCAVSP